MTWFCFKGSRPGKGDINGRLGKMQVWQRLVHLKKILRYLVGYTIALELILAIFKFMSMTKELTCGMILDCDLAVPIKPVRANDDVVDAHVSLVPWPELISKFQPACTRRHHLNTLAPKLASQLYLTKILPPFRPFWPPAWYRRMMTHLNSSV